MPVKKRVSKARDWRITPDAVEAYRLAESLKRQANGDPMAHDFPERDTYMDACATVRRTMGVKPWQIGPTDDCAAMSSNPFLPDPSPYEASWERAHEMWAELEAAS